jgi:hypothetical protein
MMNDERLTINNERLTMDEEMLAHFIDLIKKNLPVIL